ncbi:YcgL domain-containing protein [Shewanella sp. C32]|uniref:YcgL domain-containing protein L9G74_19515 n=1 Tax=Shewanella electrica TaxID=515560 RepID=A0ABT2FTX8_9GAMM|nr:YcgL domain-containing protein [Shewanella electrica]MCH1927014.1 YcgL domain-containing protein [Shewanella electrica]MCS4558631.1 YcgL domain-containing protein [Shewanella electrica]
MICAVYKSLRKADTYLFIKQKDKFEDVPKSLLDVFGQPKLVMLLPIEKRDHLGFADINKVKAALAEQGFYLQLPPPQINLLKQHLQSNGVS